MEISVSWVADIVSIFAGLMTIIGLGGVVTWSFTRKGRQDFADTTISVFALSVKIATCGVLLWILALPAALLHMIIVASLGDGSFLFTEYFWASEKWYAYIVSYLLALLIWVPVFLLTCACIFSWSVVPLKLFFRRFTNAG